MSAELGQDLFLVSFDEPYWQQLKERLHPAPQTSRALLDNSTVQNAFTVMTEGLGDPQSARAAMLADLTTFFTALTHFDEVIVLAHDSRSPAFEALPHLLASAPPQVVDWDREQATNPPLPNQLYLIFNAIQARFLERNSLREEWASRWSKLWEQPVRPVSFGSGALDRLLDSPAHPLHHNASEFEFALADPSGRLQQGSRFQMFRHHLSADHYLSALASYHTYRSLFYYRLADHLGCPYVPCGVRSHITDFLEARHLTGTGDHLNPSLPLSLQKLASLPGYRRFPPRIELPVLGLQPVLNLVLTKMRDYNTPAAPNWPRLIQELRAESEPFRRTLTEFLTKYQEDGFHFGEVGRFVQPFLHPDIKEAGGSALKVAGYLTAGYLAADPAKTVQGLAEAAARNPLEFFSRWTGKRKVRFLLDAAHLASESASVESHCKSIWERGFTSAEAAYLKRLIAASE